jgi:hypothetical protein
MSSAGAAVAIGRRVVRRRMKVEMEKCMII